MSLTLWLLTANTVLFVLLGVISALKSGDTKWPFVWGFFSILPATLILAWFGTGAPWRRVMIITLVALYVARMLYTLLVWFKATGASKLKDQSSKGALIALPLVLVPVFGWLYPLPFFVAMDRASPFDLYDAAALICYAAGTLFHFGSDLQKWRFKQDSQNRGMLLRSGFWGMSRHPNYFGDFLIFVSFAIFAIWPWGLVSPLTNLIQYFTDAIPKNEKQAQLRYGKDWDSYARETPIFLPLGSPTSKPEHMSSDT